MGLPKVDKFFCCATLETGGLVIGWLYTIVSFLVILIAIGAVILTYYAYLQPDGTFDEFYQTLLVVLIVIASIYVIYFLIVFVASILLIRATRKRDHSNMMMFMVLMAIGVILSFLQIFTIGYSGIGIAIFGAGFNAYVFLCIYSLYDKFRNEKLGINAPGTQQTVVYVQPQQPYGQPPYGVPQPYQQQQPYAGQNQQIMQQATTYVQPPVYTQQAHIQAVAAETRATETTPKTEL